MKKKGNGLCRARQRFDEKISGDKFRRILLVMTFDVLGLFGAFFAGLWLRFDFSISAFPTDWVKTYLCFSVIWCAVTFIVFALCKLYHSIWHLPAWMNFCM